MFDVHDHERQYFTASGKTRPIKEFHAACTRLETSFFQCLNVDNLVLERRPSLERKHVVEGSRQHVFPEFDSPRHLGKTAYVSPLLAP